MSDLIYTACSDKDWLVMGQSIDEVARKLDSISGLEEWVAGDESLLLRFKFRISRKALIDSIKNAEPSEKEISVSHHEIPVRYDGEDLEEVCELLGIQKKEFIKLHSTTVYHVAFMGFSPGFPYLLGLDEKLKVPRKKTPRTRMKKGAVAIAESYASVYSVESPGGWNWIGNTETSLFEAESDSPFLLKPYDTVKFVPVS